MFSPYLIIPFLSWLVAQVIKFLTRAFGGKIDFRLLYVSGGMPSAHAAVVSSLALTALILEGPGSSLFGLTAILAMIVMYDALGVRRMAGDTAAAFNRLVNSLRESRLGLAGEPLRELKGHTPAEVGGGAILGGLMAALANSSRLESQFDFLGSPPVRIEAMAYAGLFALLVVGGFVFRAVMNRRHRKSPAVANVTEAVLIKTQAIGWPGLVLAFAGYQKASFLAWRVWPLALIATLAVWDAALIRKYRYSLPKVLAAEADADRKQRWLRAKR